MADTDFRPAINVLKRYYAVGKWVKSAGPVSSALATKSRAANSGLNAVAETQFCTVGQYK